MSSSLWLGVCTDDTDAHEGTFRLTSPQSQWIQQPVDMAPADHERRADLNAYLTESSSDGHRTLWTGAPYRLAPGSLQG